MSKTKFVKFGNQGFWAYDVALHVLLKHLIDAAEASSHADATWLSSAVSSWRLACIPDYGLTLDADWSSVQWQMFITLAERACAKLATQASISAEEIVSWPILDDVRIFPRGAMEVQTAPVVELGRAIIALVSGQLPQAPKGQIWLYGTPDGRQTLGWNG